MAGFCYKCGGKLKESSKFCPECGTSVMSRDAADSMPVQVQTVQLPVCAYCGAQLKATSKFCPKCGNETERQAAQSPKCAYCGAELKETSKFCPKCGRSVVASTAAQTGRTSSAAPVQYAQPAPQNAPRRRNKAQSTKISPAMRTLIVVLAVLLAVEGTIAGLWFGGVLPGTKGTEGFDEDAVVNSLADLVEYAATADLPLRYTDEQLKNAPVDTADVTTAGGEIKAGKVTVSFHDYSLDEDCEMNIRELPELCRKDKEGNGFGLKAYDVSLSSGQHLFPSDVTVDIPRTVGENETGSVVWFNEDEDRWENIYSEVSEDGQYYHVYIDHFTIVAEKTFTFDIKSLSVKESGKSFRLDSGIFATLGSPQGPVIYDQNQVWAMALSGKLNDSSQDMAEYCKTVKMISSQDFEDNKDQEEAEKILGVLYGGASSAGGLVDLTKLQGDLPTFTKYTGKLASILDVVFTIEKIIYDIQHPQNKKSTATAKFINALKNRDLDIYSSTLTLLGFIPSLSSGPVGWTLYGVSVALYCYSLYQTFTPEKTLKDYLKQFESTNAEFDENYIALYYALNMVFVKSADPYASDADIYSYVLPKVPSMNQEWYDAFKTIFDQELADYSYVHYTYAELFDKCLRRKDYVSSSDVIPLAQSATLWKHLIRSLIQSCNEPSKLEDVINEVFAIIAHAYYDLDATTQNYVRADFKYMFPNTKFVHKYELSVHEVLRNEFLPLFKSVSQDIVRDTFTECINMLDDLTAYLNTTMEFYVEDEEADDFKDSAYNFDYMTLEENKTLLEGGSGSGATADDLLLMMRFHDAKEALFLPLKTLSGEELQKKEEYYPYDSESIPTPNYNGHYAAGADSKSLNKVFSCRMYYYLMMGAPTKMDFYDRPAKRGDKDVAFRSVKMTFPKEIEPGKAIKVTAGIGGAGIWVADQLIYDPGIVTVDGDTATRDKFGYYVLALPPLSFSEPNDFKISLQHRYHDSMKEQFSMVWFCYSDGSEKYDQFKEGYLLSEENNKITDLIPDPKPGESFYIAICDNITQSIIGIRYTCMAGAGEGYTPEHIDVTKFSTDWPRNVREYGRSGQWMPNHQEE